MTCKLYASPLLHVKCEAASPAARGAARHSWPWRRLVGGRCHPCPPDCASSACCASESARGQSGGSLQKATRQKFTSHDSLAYPCAAIEGASGRRYSRAVVDSVVAHLGADVTNSDARQRAVCGMVAELQDRMQTRWSASSTGVHRGCKRVMNQQAARDDVGRGQVRCGQRCVPGQ